MSFLPAEKDRPRRGPMWPVQRWADENPALGLLFAAAVVLFGLAMIGLELIEPFQDPDYFFVALFAFLTLRAAWTMWRQYQRIRHW